MTIYDLEKQATPGPLVADGCQVVCDMGDPHFLAIVADCSQQMQRLDSDEYMPGDAELAHNAKLLAHCRNHFMEALHGMAHVRNELLATRGDETAEQLTAFINDAKEELAKLIAKLEELK